MENKCHHMDRLEGGQIFLKDQIKNLWVTLQENQPDNALIQAIEHLNARQDEHEKNILLWSEFWQKEKDTAVTKNNLLNNLETKISQLAEHFETELAKVVSNIPGPQPPQQFVQHICEIPAEIEGHLNNFGAKLTAEWQTGWGREKHMFAQ